MKPTIGRIVLFRNGAGEWPAIVTCVYTDTCVSLMVFPEYADPFRAGQVDQNESLEDDSDLGQIYVWRWPPRA